MKRVLVVILVFAGLSTYATDYYPNGEGAFEDADTWNGGDTYPGEDDAINYTYYPAVPATNIISLYADHTIGDVTFTNAANLTFSSGDGSAYTLTIDDLNLTNYASLVVQSGVTLIITGSINTNGGVITVEDGASIIVYGDATFGGSGGTFNVESGGNLTVGGTMSISGGTNILNIAGTLTVTDFTASGGNQELNIESGGVVSVLNDVSYSGSATFDVENGGDFNIGGNFSATGGSSGVLDGNMDVEGTLYTAIDITGTGTVSAGDYQAKNGSNGTIFGVSADDFEDGKTYSGAGGTVVQINPLPIELSDFEVQAVADEIQISWTTASEENNDYFTLERSTDGLDFEEIYYEAGAGNSDVSLSYSYTDEPTASGIYYYRLKQTDYDGAYTYSETESVNYQLEAISEQVQVWMSSEILNLRFDASVTQVQLQLLNITGQLILQETLADNASFQLTTQGLNPGLTLVVLSAGDQVLATEKIFIP